MIRAKYLCGVERDTWAEVHVTAYDTRTGRYTIRHGQLTQSADVDRLIFASQVDLIRAGEMARAAIMAAPIKQEVNK